MKLVSLFGALVVGAASLMACSAAPEQDGASVASEALTYPHLPDAGNASDAGDAGGGWHLCGPGLPHAPRCPAGYMCSIDGLDTGHCIPIPTPKPHCNVATDCSGALPLECRICEDGTFSCAHWTCESGACGVATCPAP